MNRELRCPVCGKYEFLIPDSREACHVCGWKDDIRQRENPDWKDGINRVSLNEYKIRFEEWVNY